MKRNIFVKKLFLLCVLILTIALAACGQTDQEIHTRADAKSDLYESVSELDAKAAVIVRVKRMDEAENVAKSMGSGNFYGYTKSMVTVEEIMKNTSGQSIHVGDQIQILENQFSYTDGDGRKVTCHVNQYNMMEPGHEYFLYLHYSDQDEWYVVLGGIFGKVPVSEEENVLFPASDITFYKDQPQENAADSDTEEILRKIRTESLELYDQNIRQ